MTPDKFVFHISDPNNEDVEPVAYRDWLAVADGMGGSGCMKHEVREKFRYRLSRILEYVLPEYIYDRRGQQESEFRAFAGEDPHTSYLARIFAPCIRDAVNTSARWASRIVMTRFLYYICEKNFDPGIPGEIDALRDFLQRGLKKTADTLSLTVSDPNMSLLPTTFAALRYRPLSEEEYEVYAVWAGDSRCYLLNEEGLAWLSADDENEYKQLTNCFAAEGRTELHCRRYVLKKPFLLFCASDGFFDAYDKYELSVEARLLNDIFEAKDFNGLRERLAERYKGNAADDTSVALAGVGFSEYSELWTMLTGRWKRVEEIYKMHCEYARIASLISRPEQHVTGTVCDRFETRFSQIVRRIVAAGFEGQNDPLVTPHWQQLISESGARKEKELRERLDERKAELMRIVWEEIGKSGYEACFASDPDLNAPWGKALKAFCEADHSKARARKESDLIDEKVEALISERSSLLAHIHEKMGETCGAFQALLPGDPAAERTEGELNELLSEHIHRYKQLKFWVQCEYLLLKNEGYDAKAVSSDDKEMLKKIRDFNSREREINREKRDAKETGEKWEKECAATLLKLKPYIGAMLERRNTVFSAEFIEKMRMDEAMNGVIDREELLAAVTDDLVASYADDPGILRETLDAWKQITDQTTCIDDLFAAGKLYDFRLYYKNRNLAASEEFCRYTADLKQIESEYGRMLSLGDETQDDGRKAEPAEEQGLAEIPEVQIAETSEKDHEETEVPEEAPGDVASGEDEKCGEDRNIGDE